MFERDARETFPFSLDPLPGLLPASRRGTCLERKVPLDSFKSL